MIAIGGLMLKMPIESARAEQRSEWITVDGPEQARPVYDGGAAPSLAALRGASCKSTQRRATIIEPEREISNC